ncbi:MAG: Fur family transcriptional regulator [Tepidiformaceae bacterium]
MIAGQETADRLATVGHRLTGPRRAVLDAIAASRAPFTVEELCVAAPDVGRATVFRTVRLLQDLDMVCRLPLEDGSVRYQLSQSEHHHHLICSECGAVAEFSDAPLDRLIQEDARAERFELEGHSLELYGRCARCSGQPPR